MERYAIYWAPPAEGKLARLGAAWLGWDAEAGVAPAPPDWPLPEGLDRAALTDAPARYGLHGTLKAPFRPADGVSGQDLRSRLAGFAARQPAVTAPPLALSTALGFLALSPAGPSPELDRLAAACVAELDDLRAPLTEAEIARRRAGGLTAEEDANLRRWGYPHVLEAFRFHVTLSRRLEAERLAALEEAFAPHLAPALGERLEVTEIALFGDPGGGAPFRLLHRYALTG